MSRLTKKAIYTDWNGNEIETPSIADNLPFGENSHDFKTALIEKLYYYEEKYESESEKDEN